MKKNKTPTQKKLAAGSGNPGKSPPLSSRPKPTLEELSITDLIKKSDLQKFQDAFSKATGAALTLTDVNGVPILKPSLHTRVCKIIRETETGLKRCIYSGKILGEISKDSKTPRFHYCKSIGFLDAAAPIVIEGVHMANWLIGQNCIGSVDEKRVVSYAEEIGADKDALVEAFHEIKPISEQEFKKKINLLWLVAGQISSLAYEKLKSFQAYEETKKSRDELKVYKNNLEKIVEKRTQLLNAKNQQLRLEIKSRRQNEKALALSEKRFRSIFEESKDAIFSVRADGTLEMLNPAGLKLFGLSDIETESIQFKDLFEDQAIARRLTAKILKHSFLRDFGAQLKGSKGSTMDCMMTVNLKTSPDGTIVGYEGIVRDVTPYKKMEEGLRLLATTDSLTGINNRRNFMELANNEINRSIRYGRIFSLLMLDIDHFKKINDSFGHTAGDQVLCEFCTLCSKEIRRSDFIGRIGGEEFAIGCAESDAATARILAERIRSVVESYKVKIDNKKVGFTVSIGIAELGRTDNLNTMLQHADRALYEAKENGRNRVTVYRQSHRNSPVSSG